MVKDERNYLEIIALAQLTIQVDRYIRETEIARPKPRSIDKMLSDVGLKTNDIAKLLGKTERAVQMQIASDSKTKKNKTLEKVKGESTK
ncbi:MAG: hypothetical protein HXL01_00955 [Candidatus Nanosynbacter sp.]|jgi:hypothetical protein|nr:hypothetical protein [Candidatus Nanosynbacter sp.]